MEESTARRGRGGVTFLNVARIYVPNTKVECHYTLPPGTAPNASDWIGIFKVEATSVRDYHTFVWSVVPENTVEGGPVHSSVQFQAGYLPKPGTQQYQFRYVSRQGRVCGQSPPFQFREPRPMDDLVTLEEADGGGDMLLVVPKAAVLQTQLDESQQERNDLMRLKLWLEGEVEGLRARVRELQEELDANRGERAGLADEHQALSRAHSELVEERAVLIQRQGEQAARIMELEGDIQAVSEKVLAKEVELDRVRGTAKGLMREQERLQGQLKEEQASREQSQEELRASQSENRQLNSQLREAKDREGQAAAQARRLREEVGRLRDQLDRAQPRMAQVEGLREQLRETQDLLASSQQKAALLGEELAGAAATRDRTIAELHRSRLEAAETSGKLDDLAQRRKEDRGQWSKERASLLQNVEAEKDKILKLSAEVLRLEKGLREERSQRQSLKTELSRERDSNLVQLSETRRELKELRSALRVFQKEKEQLQEEKQELLDYVRKLEARLEKVADEKWSEVAGPEDEEAAAELGCPDSALPDSEEDESPEDMRLAAQLSPYGLCDRGDQAPTPPGAREPTPRVVISQPAPIAAQIKGTSEASSSDSVSRGEGSPEAWSEATGQSLLTLRGTGDGCNVSPLLLQPSPPALPRASPHLPLPILLPPPLSPCPPPLLSLSFSSPIPRLPLVFPSQPFTLWPPPCPLPPHHP
ncbi:calcium-binding and coiled-coil domain-containing protein 1 isoform X1 [Tachyglossus aculeatus]|uniref:calcium-binding and coiled-coil domain-containing protein 1 isoform X1 n=1 Tax=Tachyglossus aculeatus TaxID=9261 RepID=UPI0018F75216|nr:calcium-binding and coiled-coil domain-containing protein 1 isoform X1 [Tachyglossus aculeatus]